MALAAQNVYVQHEYSTEEIEDFNTELETQAAQPSAKSSAHTPTNRLTFPDEQALGNDTSFDQAQTNKPRSRTRRHHDDADMPRSYREWEETRREESAAPRRVALRSHRTFRMTWTTTLVGTLLFAQLLGALYLKALAVSASHRVTDLEKAIIAEEAAIDKTQRKLSLASSDPRMGTWAEKAGYKLAAQSDLDDVMNPQPLPQPEGKADGKGDPDGEG